MFPVNIICALELLLAGIPQLPDLNGISKHEIIEKISLTKLKRHYSPHLNSLNVQTNP